MRLPQRRWLAAWSLASILVGAGRAQAAVIDPGFEESVFASALGKLTGMAWAPDGSERLFYLIQSGKIGVIENGAPLPEPFAMVSPIFMAFECGLIGIGIDPGFASNGHLYVFVTVSQTEQQIIRYTADGNVGIDPTIVMSGLPTRGINHNGGAVGVGPDGKLYWSIGDNGNLTGVDADLISLAAKVGRANLDGSAPSDNPFFDGDGANNDFIWAQGFRNPFSFTWQPSTERLWVSVAGTVYEQIFTPQAGDNAGYDKYESNQPAGFIPPAVSYRTDNITQVAAVTATRTNGVVTFTTSPGHRFWPGTKITITGMADPSFDQSNYVVDVLSVQKFTFAQPGPDATTTGGVASTQAIGGAVTGATFWDSSAVPTSHRGNFFFGDFNSGRVMRATFDAQNKISTVDEWATAITQSVDVEVGPDGALYYASLDGTIRRTSYRFPAQALIVSKLHLRSAEGTATGFNVRLGTAPESDVSVAVRRERGDSDVTVAEGEMLTFTPSDWAIPQAVLVAAAHDEDSVDDEAALEVAMQGVESETVRARVTDDDSFGIVVSTTSLSLPEGRSLAFDVQLSQPPRATVNIDVARESGDADLEVTSGTALEFNEETWSTPQSVVITAAEDKDGEADVALIALSSPGLETRIVSVLAIDDDSADDPASAGGSAGAAAGDAGSDSTNPGALGTAGEPAGGAPAETRPSADASCDCRAPRTPADVGALAFSLLVLAACSARRRVGGLP